MLLVRNSRKAFCPATRPPCGWNRIRFLRSRDSSWRSSGWRRRTHPLSVRHPGWRERQITDLRL